MKQKKVYLSGPISGLERSDYMQRFAIAERALRKQGYKVCNPTRTWVCRLLWLYRLVGYRATLCYDLWLLMHCDHIFLMPGYYNSKGALIEESTANRMGITTMLYEDWRHVYGAVVDFINEKGKS